jgi:hypothetical protein
MCCELQQLLCFAIGFILQYVQAMLLSYPAAACGCAVALIVLLTIAPAVLLSMQLDTRLHLSIASLPACWGQ